jgi:hypothetical protein
MIIFSHGDKGGTGKSMASVMLIETLLDHGKSVVLVESDESTPDVARRYEHVDGVTTILCNLNRAGDEINAVSDFAAAVDGAAPAGSGKFVIVNLPGGAGETIDSQSKMLVDAFKDIGTEIRVCYSLGDAPVQSLAMVESFGHGLCGAVDPSKVQILLAGWQSPIDNFHWMKMKERTALLRRGLRDEYLVRIIQTAAVRPLVFSSKGRLSDLLSKLKLMERGHFYQLLRDYKLALEPILGLTENVVSIEPAAGKKGYTPGATTTKPGGEPPRSMSVSGLPCSRRYRKKCDSARLNWR